jgi:hypothetical protein
MKSIPKEGGSKQLILQPQMNCKFCSKELTKIQIHEYLRGKTNGTCSRSCGNLYRHYFRIENAPMYQNGRKLYEHNCHVCKNDFKSTVPNQSCCSMKCVGVISSKRMTINNPMKDIETRKKVSNTLKDRFHKPPIIGGNGRGLTKWQKILLDELLLIDKTFVAEYIFNTKEFNQNKIYPNHYKIDIASEKYKLAIEVDGNTHKSNKIKLCDQKKTHILNLSGWTVLRFWNTQIEMELKDCVQMVMSMI